MIAIPFILIVFAAIFSFWYYYKESWTVKSVDGGYDPNERISFEYRGQIIHMTAFEKTEVWDNWNREQRNFHLEEIKKGLKTYTIRLLDLGDEQSVFVAGSKGKQAQKRQDTYNKNLEKPYGRP